MSAAVHVNRGLDFLRTRDTIDNEETSYQQLTQCIVGIMNMYWTEKNNNINIGSEVAIFYAPFLQRNLEIFVKYFVLFVLFCNLYFIFFV